MRLLWFLSAVVMGLICSSQLARSIQSDGGGGGNSGTGSANEEANESLEMNSAEKSGGSSRSGIVKQVLSKVESSKKYGESEEAYGGQTTSSGETSHYKSGSLPISSVEDVKKDIFDVKKIAEWAKLMFNPFELAKAISEHFKLPFGKFIEKLGKDMVMGLEPLLYPLVFTVHIVEKVFVPDQCRLRFICTMGKQLEFLRQNVVSFTPNFLEGSSQLKALSEGIVGHDCDTIFQGCEPKLKKPYEEIRGDPLGKSMGPKS